MTTVTTHRAPGLDLPLKFQPRPGTSDIKSIEEVIIRRGYARHGFTPRPGEHWLDLGGNIGAFSIWAAAHGANVTAFEPEPGCLAQFTYNLGLNDLPGKVEVVPAAVGLQPGRAILSVNSANGNVWRSSLLHRWRGGHDVEVNVVGLPLYWDPEVCVKMDIEGAEVEILLALARKPVRRLVFEWSFDIVPDMDLFRAVMTDLADTYEHLGGVPSSDRTRNADRWVSYGANNAATIYCW